MYPYLKQLLDEIQRTARSEYDSFGKPEATTYLKRIDEVERNVEVEAGKPISHLYIGLYKKHFPPSEEVSEEDIETILQAIDQMLETRSLTVDYPQNVQIKDRYEFILKHVLDIVLLPVSHGSTYRQGFCCLNSDFDSEFDSEFDSDLDIDQVVEYCSQE